MSGRTSYDLAFLEDDDDLRESLAAVFEARHLGKCLALRSFSELIEHEADALLCKAFIIDINLGAGAPSGLDAHRWLRARSYGGKELFLTGHAFSDPALVEATQLDSVSILSKPASFEVIMSSVGFSAA